MTDATKQHLLDIYRHSDKRFKAACFSLILDILPHAQEHVLEEFMEGIYGE